jgi:hypothetical protein
MRIPALGLIVASIVALGLSACGAGGGGASSSASSNALSGGPNAPASAAAGPGVLSAEARSKATGDIPDSQVFLSFHNQAAGYSVQYPEGWAQRGSANDVTFQNKDNVIHVLISKGPAPTAGSVLGELARERQSRPSLTYGQVSTQSILGAPVLKVSYSTISPPNPVTGKRVQLLVDRYVYVHAGKLASVDLGTVKGVDNVDAYKMISRSFRWR